MRSMCTLLLSLLIATPAMAVNYCSFVDPVTKQRMTLDMRLPIVDEQPVLTYSFDGSSAYPSDNAPYSPEAACATIVGSTGFVTWDAPAYSGALPLAGTSYCNAPNGNGPGVGISYGLSPIGWGSACPNGYTSLGAGKCKLTLAVQADTALIDSGGSIARNSTTGVPTSLYSPDAGGTWTVSTSDSLGRPTAIIQPNSTVTYYTYEGNSPRIATRTTVEGTTSYVWNSDGMTQDQVTLPDGTIYNLQQDNTYNPTHLKNVGVVHGVVGGTRAGTLAPWGVAIPYVTSSLKLPDDTMLAMLMQGLELPEQYFHPEAVGNQPYASMISPGGLFVIEYGPAPGSGLPPFPIMDPLVPSPAQDLCKLAQDYSRPIPNPAGGSSLMSGNCQGLFLQLMGQHCPVPSGGGNCSAHVIDYILQQMIAGGCG